MKKSSSIIAAASLLNNFAPTVQEQGTHADEQVKASVVPSQLIQRVYCMPRILESCNNK